MTESFWSDGPRAYADGLREQYGLQLQNLRRRRNNAAASEQADIDSEIERLEAEYQAKLRSIGERLF